METGKDGGREERKEVGRIEKSREDVVTARGGEERKIGEVMEIIESREGEE